jgi:hypothetical protein
MSLNERTGYGPLGRKLHALRSRPLMAIAFILALVIAVTLVVVLNHSDDLGQWTSGADATEHSHHLPPLVQPAWHKRLLAIREA